MNQEEREELAAAYLDTNYVALVGKKRLVIRIGERNPGVDELLDKGPVEAWTFITAYNPYSIQVSVEKNQRRQDVLCRELSANNFTYFTGFGEAANGEWPPEPSLLVIGIGREKAIRLAVQFEQNAIVCGRKGEKPELVWAKRELINN